MKWRKVLCNVMLLMPASIPAAEMHYSAGTIMMHSTNLNHEPVPADSELSQTLRGRVSAVENTANLAANVDASLEATRYSNNLAADSTQGRLLGNALWYIKPGQFEWFLSNVFTQTITDPLESDTQDNRENANAFSSGPNYYMRLSSQSSLEFEGRVENFSYEIAETDNNRVFGASRLGYAFNSSMNANLNYEITYVTFDNEVVNTSFDRNDIFLGLGYQRGADSIEMQAGYTTINNYTADDRDESRYLIAFQNQRTRTTMLRVEYAREISDSGTDILDITVPGESAVSATADLYIRTTASLDINKTMSAGLLTINGYKSDSDYINENNLDRSVKGASINNLWNIHGRSSLAVDASYAETTYWLSGRVDEDSMYGLSYSYVVGRNIDFIVSTEQIERESTDMQHVYDDTRIILTLEYTSR